MKKLWMIFILCGGVLGASWALGVSQVGGGKVSSVDLGYSANVPATFSQGFLVGPQGVQLQSGFLAQNPFGNRLGSLVINLYELPQEWPHLAQLNTRQDFQTALIQLGWSRVTIGSDPCLEIFEKDSSTTISIVIGWGPQKGLHLVGPLSTVVRQGIQDLVQTLTLNPGACSWK